MTDQPATGSGKGRATGCLVIAALVIGIPVACTAIASVGGGDDDWKPTATEARLICEGWVRDQLKAPSTARFVDGTTTGGPTAYTVTGAVDAENSFGAKLRTDWTCDVEYREADQQWHGRAVLDE